MPKTSHICSILTIFSQRVSIYYSPNSEGWTRTAVSPKPIMMRVEYAHCPSLTIIDTPGLVLKAKKGEPASTRMNLVSRNEEELHEDISNEEGPREDISNDGQLASFSEWIIPAKEFDGMWERSQTEVTSIRDKCFAFHWEGCKSFPRLMESNPSANQELRIDKQHNLQIPNNRYQGEGERERRRRVRDRINRQTIDASVV